MLVGRQTGRKALLLGTALSSLVCSTLATNTTDAPTYSSKTIGSGSAAALIAVNVPDDNSNDLFFHFEAPASGYAWAAFGMGSVMNNALMFVVYSSGNGPPTVSPRLGSGHSMPQYTSDVNITVLSGSKVTSDQFVANFHCGNCRSWNGGSVDVTSDSAPFIYAIGNTGTLQSTSQSANIQQHSNRDNGWTLSMKEATGTAGVPLSGGSSNSTGSTGNNTDSGTDNNNTDNNNYQPSTTYISSGALFHGGVMALAFGLIYPLGYLLLRLFDRVWLHAGAQSFGLLLTILGAGSGIAVSIRDSINPDMNHPHQIIGLIVFGLILATWTIGLWGHLHYKRTQTPHPVMKGHRIIGPVAIVLGSINAIVGFLWVGLKGALTGYVMFTVAMIAIVGGVVFIKTRSKRRKQAMNSQAANNFREGYDQQMPGYGPPPTYGQNVPMQPMGMEHGRVEYYNVQPNK